MEAGEKTRISFGRRLRAFREAAGISAEEMGRKLRIHSHSVYRLERGDQWVGADVLERIGDELNLDLARLFSDHAPAPTPLEALEVVARELHRAQERTKPAGDPLAEKLARLAPSARAAIEAMVDSSLLQEAPKQDGKPPEKGK